MFTEMNEDEIKNAIIDIMTKDGPDSHIDGYDIITIFIIELLKGKGKKWIYEYRKNKKI